MRESIIRVIATRVIAFPRVRTQDAVLAEMPSVHKRAVIAEKSRGVARGFRGGKG